MVDRFDKEAPKKEEKNERPTPPPKKATLPPEVEAEETPEPEDRGTRL